MHFCLIINPVLTSFIQSGLVNNGWVSKLAKFVQSLYLPLRHSTASSTWRWSFGISRTGHCGTTGISLTGVWTCIPASSRVPFAAHKSKRDSHQEHGGLR